jgi:DNA ligase (NAD+)
VQIGDTVLVERAGDVIPHVVRVVKPGEHRRPSGCPQACPICGGEIVRVEGRIRQPLHQHQLSGAFKGKPLLHWAARGVMNIDGMGEGAGGSTGGQGLGQECRRSLRVETRRPDAPWSAWARSRPRKVLANIDASRRAPLPRILNGLGIPSWGTHRSVPGQTVRRSG